MKLSLICLPDTVRSIYNGPLPKRMRRLHPRALCSFLKMEEDLGGLVYSDMFRSAEGSLVARQQKSGVQRPAYSAHNYGLAVDIAVDQILKEKGWAYDTLLSKMALYGWHCHRRDRKRGSEDWHFNCLSADPSGHVYPNGADVSDPASWSLPAENLIQACYGSQMDLTTLQVQEALKKLGFYKGEVDGDFGPLSKEALSAFRRAWVLPEKSSFIGKTDKRTLAFVAADVVVADF